jgi:hypothetical protein
MQRPSSLLWMDERTERINGRISFFCLMLTQIALAGVIFYKRYVLGLPQEEYIELDWIAGLSIGGYWVARLYLILGFYALVAYLGKRRLEKYIPKE